MVVQDLILAATTPAPSQSGAAPEPLSVTPGLVGFAVTFAIAVVVILLMVDMNRRMRRLRYRGQTAAADQTSQDVEGHHRV